MTPTGTCRILLTSVFGPYAQDDAFGSRATNPMELYHNQVTRSQGAYSLRMFHRSWGIMMIRENISAPCTLLDFPTREVFERELRRGAYDVVGISSIVVNVGKVQEMCRMVRQLSPRSTIIVGGHVTSIAGLEAMIDADHIVRGDGIAWMRRFLGEDETAPIKHPKIYSGYGLRVMGVSAPSTRTRTAATVIPSVGCPMGCDFCTTSAFFGGKGNVLNFYKTGDELFQVMSEMERSMKVHSFFIMDENFLLYRRRAMELLERMKAASKSWALYVFSSANALQLYSLQELVDLGVSWVWMGLESAKSSYAKLKQTDTQSLVKDLRSHGIKVLGSTIVGLEHHTPANIAEEIEHAVAHETDLHQFMLFTPMPGTPLEKRMTEEGRMLPGVDPADIHGQFRFNFQHPAITPEQSEQFLLSAFWRDLERNGPSLFRICRTMLEGWKRYKDDADPRIRERFRWEIKPLKQSYNAALWAMERKQKDLREQIHTLRREIEREFGLPTWLRTRLLGPLLWLTAQWEERRLARGWTYEPKPIIERR